MGSSVTEVWMTPGGALSFVEWNPCGCHPKDLVLTRRIYKHAHWVNDAVCYLNQSRSGWTRELRRKGWERLDRWKEAR